MLIELLSAFQEGLHGIVPGDRLDVLYWMHRLEPDRRAMLKVHPRGDASRPIKGVFGLRSPMRPNPIGVSGVAVLRIEGTKLYVTPFDAKDGSPIVDIKAGKKGAKP
jgi:tRNA-Thr(GGU) m(6)t(6)A37 methyltransferase TsaA